RLNRGRHKELLLILFITPIEIAARSGMREHVEILFPVTSRIPKVRDWSVDGI
uniref:Uncharacterized protein n=1 Tax=Aegilops tauschii subsp. strangulata TaxID=200361 RepID=A0A453HU54_AEGTS